MTPSVAVVPEENTISGIWKFHPRIPVETVVQVARELRAEQPGAYQNMHVRSCGNKQLGISFVYVSKESVRDWRGKVSEDFFNPITDKLYRRFGNGFIGWDVTNDVWSINVKISPQDLPGNLRSYHLSAAPASLCTQDGFIFVNRGPNEFGIINFLDVIRDPDRVVQAIGDVGYRFMKCLVHYGISNLVDSVNIVSGSQVNVRFRNAMNVVGIDRLMVLAVEAAFDINAEMTT